MVQTCPVVKWSGFRMPFKIRTEMSDFRMAFRHLWTQTIRKPDIFVRFSNGYDPSKSGHAICPVFRWIRYSGVRFSDGYCILYPTDTKWGSEYRTSPVFKQWKVTPVVECSAFKPLSEYQFGFQRIKSETSPIFKWHLNTRPNHPKLGYLNVATIYQVVLI